MTALTKGRRTPSRAGNRIAHPLAAGAKVFAGGIGVLDAGYLKPGRAATGLIAVGVIEDDADNSAGTDGDVVVTVSRGTFQLDNDGTDPVGREHIGLNAYIVDDQTVAATDGEGTRSIAGKIIDVDAAGVWVEF
jgi:hypothetical protein